MYLVAAVLSGVMLAIYQHTRAGYYLERLIRGGAGHGSARGRVVLLRPGGAAGAYGLAGLGMSLLNGRMKGRRYCRGDAGLRRSEASLTALIDTGNCLRGTGQQPAGPCGDSLGHR